MEVGLVYNHFSAALACIPPWTASKKSQQIQLQRPSLFAPWREKQMSELPEVTFFGYKVIDLCPNNAKLIENEENT